MADSVAIPLVQGLMQFNGSYGCTWCLCKGNSIQLPGKNNSHKWIYPPLDKESIQLRGKEQFINHLKEFKTMLSVNSKNKSHFGIKTASKLLLFPKFNIVEGFVFDYMHTALLGISRTFTNAWLDSKNHSRKFYIGRKITRIDENLLNVFVPFSFNRAVRSIKERSFWKANEWQTWSYILSIVLDGILDTHYLKHSCKFVYALVIPCSQKISSLKYAAALLFSFVHEKKSLYGE